MKARREAATARPSSPSEPSSAPDRYPAGSRRAAPGCDRRRARSDGLANSVRPGRGPLCESTADGPPPPRPAGNQSNLSSLQAMAPSGGGWAGSGRTAATGDLPGARGRLKRSPRGEFHRFFDIARGGPRSPARLRRFGGWFPGLLEVADDHPGGRKVSASEAKRGHFRSFEKRDGLISVPDGFAVAAGEYVQREDRERLLGGHLTAPPDTTA
jgi:hypothetical protein